ncbi:MAG: zinc ribbon domain-containing protein [Clostridiales bacterium]|nr:zinc ribbon domain-containing protein [Clostridiales bacterium]
MKYCSKCGKEIKDEAKFCPKCGAKQGAQNKVAQGHEETNAGAPRRQPKESPPLNPKAKLIVVGAAAVVAVIVVISLLPGTISGGKTTGSFFECYADLVYGADSVEMRDFEEAYYRRVFVTLSEEQYLDDTNGNAIATIVTPDLNIVLADVFEALRDKAGLAEDAYDREFSSGFIDSLGNHLETVTSTVAVEIVKDRDKWKIVANDEYDKAVTCDLAGLYREYYKRIVEEYINENQ